MTQKIILSISLLFMMATASAQTISDNALGLRLGASNGFGTEISYQSAIGRLNRIEANLGWRDNRNFDAFRLTGIYQWMFDLNFEEGFQWFAGVGGGIGNVNFNSDSQFATDENEFFAFVAGDVGIEYNFSIPLVISLDLKPEIGFNEFNDGIEFDLGLGIRYQF
ncbi:hypothetical protein [Spongiivirga citrea]|uniref:Outer membrane beta-barrel protein n=1 Tax=Spongiivirga citrea TaxID=1481457 RepID=A0A6M0CFA6_9FLAO|nr:hypothetical protein [Spongiivirga citrea]NER16516.1 hypothetical protein [Spongiivirga citrea]